MGCFSMKERKERNFAKGESDVLPRNNRFVVVPCPIHGTLVSFRVYTFVPRADLASVTAFVSRNRAALSRVAFERRIASRFASPRVAMHAVVVLDLLRSLFDSTSGPMFSARYIAGREPERESSTHASSLGLSS